MVQNSSISEKKCCLHLTTPMRFNPLVCHRDKFVGTETLTVSRLALTFFYHRIVIAKCAAMPTINLVWVRINDFLCVTLMGKSKFFTTLVSRWNKKFLARFIGYFVPKVNYRCNLMSNQYSLTRCNVTPCCWQTNQFFV